MNTVEAAEVLNQQLARFSNYAEVVPLVESRHVELLEMTAASGVKYQMEIQFFWDDSSKRVVRVFGSIDDGGLRAFMPLTQSLLISPE